MAEYKWPALNRLQESLSATNVLSDNYRREIMATVLQATTEAYKDGLAEGKKVHPESPKDEPKEEPESILPPEWAVRLEEFVKKAESWWVK